LAPVTTATLPSRSGEAQAATSAIKQRQLGCDLALQHLVVQLDEDVAAGLAHNLCLGRYLGRDQDSAAGRVGGIEIDPFAVAGELLDVGGNGPGALDLDDDRAAVEVAAEEGDR